MLVVPVLAACALASSNGSEGYLLPPPEYPGGVLFTFCPLRETQRLISNRMKIELAIGFKLSEPFREYEREHGMMSPRLMVEIREIFALHLIRRQDVSTQKEYDSYDFLQEPRDIERWREMMTQYTDLTYLDLYYEHPFKKPLTAEIISFFADYCGTTRLALPSCKEGPTLVGFGEPISKIQSLLIDAAIWMTYPRCLRNFTGLTDLSIWYGDHTHVCPDMTGTEQAILWPNLEEITFFMPCDVEKFSMAFLNALPGSAMLSVAIPEVPPPGKVVMRLTVEQFLTNVGKFNVFPFCEGRYRSGPSQKLRFMGESRRSRKRAYPFNR